MKLEQLNFPSFTQTTLGGMTAANEVTPNVDDSTPARRKSCNWKTDQNLVLLSAWIKYGTNNNVGRNQKCESFWGKIADYCNEHCSFDPPRDVTSCRNHYNYINKRLNKWIGAYDTATRMKQSGWSENDVMAKAHELYSSGSKSSFSLMLEWFAVRDQPRYRSLVGENTGLRNGSSGSKRSRESDPCDSNSVGSSARPMGREAAKKKGKKKSKEAQLGVVNENWNEFKQLKEKELDVLNNISLRLTKVQEEANQLQEVANQLRKEKNESQNLKMYLKLISMEHLDDRKKEVLERLRKGLFGN